MRWVEAWADANAALSPAFTRDLQTDYPAVWRRYREIIKARKRSGAELLRPLLKPQVDGRVAFALLNQIFTIVLDPEFADRLNVSRHEALRCAGELLKSGPDEQHLWNGMPWRMLVTDEPNGAGKTFFTLRFSANEGV